MKPHRKKGVPIKKALLDRGMVQREAAAELGMTLSSFNMRVRGERSFTEDEKVRLADILRKPVTKLFPNEHTTQREQNTQDQIIDASVGR